jgi:hypothetical protein
MHWVFCLMRGGHRPIRLALSTTRLVCQRCGIELDSLGTPLPQRTRPDLPPTTIKGSSRKRYR